MLCKIWSKYFVIDHMLKYTLSNTAIFKLFKTHLYHFRSFKWLCNKINAVIITVDHLGLYKLSSGRLTASSHEVPKPPDSCLNVFIRIAIWQAPRQQRWYNNTLPQMHRVHHSQHTLLIHIKIELWILQVNIFILIRTIIILSLTMILGLRSHIRILIWYQCIPNCHEHQKWWFKIIIVIPWCNVNYQSPQSAYLPHCVPVLSVRSLFLV